MRTLVCLAAFCVITLVAAGCSLPRATILTRTVDAGLGDLDAWSENPDVDTGDPNVDMGIQAGVDAAVDVDAFVQRFDSGTPDDASGPSDMGPVCMERCDGNTLVRCVGGIESPTVCGPSAFCDASGGLMCRPNVCVPTVSSCSGDGTAVELCNATGSAFSTTHCDRGCVAGACTPPAACAFTVTGTIAMSGTTTYDLCGTGADNIHNRTDPDCTVDSAGEDVILRFEVDQTRTYRIVEQDADATRDVDPVLYIRRDCGVRASEVDCDDDGGSGRDAQLDVVLTPGEYFLVVDSIDWDSGTRTYRCGRVDVVVTTP